METLIIWLGLFGATAATDWLATRWTDAATPKQRAWLASVHEAVGVVAGFTVYTIYKSLWMAVPCIIGAWIGSFYGGVSKPADSIDSDLVVGCKVCTRPFLAFTTDIDTCSLCAYIAMQKAQIPEIPKGWQPIPPEDRALAGQPIEEEEP